MVNDRAFKALGSSFAVDYYTSRISKQTKNTQVYILLYA